MAQLPSLDVAQLPDGPIELAQHLAYYEDEKHQLGPDDLIAAPDNVSFSRVDARSPDLRFNHTSSAYWFRLDLRNSSSATLTRILEIAYAPLATVELYRVSNEKTFKIAEAGTSVPFDWRSIKYRNPAFSLEIEGRAQSSYYLKVAATSALILPAKLWTPIGFTLHARQDDVFNAFYFGMVAAMIAFNLLVFARLREVVYLSYSGFLLFFAVGVAAQLGLAQQYLWPHATRWPDRANYVLFSLALGVFADFMRRMLDVRQVRAAGERVLSAMSAILFAGALLLWIALPMGAWLAVIAFLAAVVVMLTISVACAIHGQRTAKIFLLAYAALLSGALMTTLRGLGLLPTSFLTVHGLQIGSAMEMVLLAFALADRFIGLRDEVGQVQAALLASRTQVVETQAQAILALKESERELERRVEERTDQLQATNLQLDKLCRTDALTGVANRRQFDETLAVEISRAERTEQPLSLALLDVDWFKRFNDRYGHQAGDDCLQRVAALLASNVARAGDQVARYGGEEFAFIAPNTGPDAAIAMAQRVLEAVRAMGIPHEDSPLGCLTVSVGVVSCVPDGAIAAQQLLRVADQALYASKRSGRNRVCAGQATAAVPNGVTVLAPTD